MAQPLSLKKRHHMVDWQNHADAYRGVVADPGLSAQKELRMLQKKLGWHI